MRNSNPPSKVTAVDKIWGQERQYSEKVVFFECHHGHHHKGIGAVQTLNMSVVFREGV